MSITIGGSKKGSDEERLIKKIEDLIDSIDILANTIDTLETTIRDGLNALNPNEQDTISIDENTYLQYVDHAAGMYNRQYIFDYDGNIKWEKVND